MNDAPELYAIVKEWEKELKRKKINKMRTLLIILLVLSNK